RDREVRGILREDRAPPRKPCRTTRIDLTHGHPQAAPVKGGGFSMPNSIDVKKGAHGRPRSPLSNVRSHRARKELRTPRLLLRAPRMLCVQNLPQAQARADKGIRKH